MSDENPGRRGDEDQSESWFDRYGFPFFLALSWIYDRVGILIAWAPTGVAVVAVGRVTATPYAIGFAVVAVAALVVPRMAAARMLSDDYTSDAASERALAVAQRRILLGDHVPPLLAIGVLGLKGHILALLVVAVVTALRRLLLRGLRDPTS